MWTVNLRVEGRPDVVQVHGYSFQRLQVNVRIEMESVGGSGHGGEKAVRA